MRKTIFLVTAALTLLAGCAEQAPQDVLTRHDKEIDEIIAQMSLEEKVMMLHSKTIMSSEGVPRLGIQDIKYADGPFGVREELGDGFRPLGWQLDSATYFPTGSALAATWDPALAYDYGHGIGVEARLRGKDMMLGPAINIQRLPVGGRSYEYLSEDPALAAALAVGYVKGMQDAGTAACIKHFALNNQETNRGSVNVIADERVIREIYLKPFEAAVKEAGAMGVMPAYNKVNGDYCSENEFLLNQVLRGEWGFKGMTVSDWGATHSTMGAALHGLDVQMTGDNYLGPPLIDSIAAGKLSEKVVDDKVREILRVRFAIEPIPEDKCNLVQTSQPESRQAALEVARRSIVLLSNKGAGLPIAENVKTIAVIGQNAVLSTAAGGVGAGVKTPYEVTPLEGIKRRAGDGIKVIYAPGYKNYGGRIRPGQEPGPLQALAIDEKADHQLISEAMEVASQADLVLFFCGTNKTIETEGSDRQNIKLPTGQEAAAAAISLVNPNMVSIVISGGPLELTNIETCSTAVVQGWWNGIEGGTALAEILFGDRAPSGKLPFTYPIALEHSPAYAMGNFPNRAETQEDLFTGMYRADMAQGGAIRRQAPDSKYTEGLLVGYRWFDTKDIPVAYAFGHGLSYVNFRYSGLKASKKAYTQGETIKVSFKLKNTGRMPAEEVAQLYVSRKDAKVEYPLKELKAFKRVALKAGQSKKVTLEVPVSELCWWSDNGWELEKGTVELLLGSASDDLRQRAQIEIK
ncbi:MAG: glycoside hydrolase family 3 C-terminal domain-containing protein [Bacteroidales bacterium]|nr:glycoside hydrolase family 3 C-terminal domain-containing protein [Bacteroidales bacterium]